MVSTCASYSLNTMLSVPLLIVIPRCPSLLRHTRFLLLIHLLLCNNLQVGLHILILDFFKLTKPFLDIILTNI